MDLAQTLLSTSFLRFSQVNKVSHRFKVAGWMNEMKQPMIRMPKAAGIQSWDVADEPEQGSHVGRPLSGVLMK